MNNDIGFQVICTNCGCLSIKIEEPLNPHGKPSFIVGIVALLAAR